MQTNQTLNLDRHNEQEHGIYKFQQLYTEASSKPTPSLNNATYTGSVGIRSAGSHGRGLFTTKAVKAGDLLLCEKAFAYAVNDTKAGKPDLTGMIIQKLELKPDLLPAFTDLHHGSYEPVSTSDSNGKPVVDRHLIELIIALNAFGSPLSSRRNFLDGSSQRPTDKDQFYACGVWIKASYINHACDCNAERSFIGDMMIIRATRDIEPDSEITFRYATPEIDNFDVYRAKHQHWGFLCDCIICEDYKKTESSVLQRRTSLRLAARQYIHFHPRPDVAEIEGMVAALADTYSKPADEVPRLGIWDVQRSLGRKFLQYGQPGNAIDAVLSVFESLGYVIEGGRAADTPLVIRRWGLMLDHLVETWLILAEAYQRAVPELEVQAEGYARITYKICVGEDETFEDTYVVTPSV